MNVVRSKGVLMVVLTVACGAFIALGNSQSLVLHIQPAQPSIRVAVSRIRSPIDVAVSRRQPPYDVAANQTRLPFHSAGIPAPGESSCDQLVIAPEGSLPLVALISLPGSGNTWTRHLVEQVTGIYTGSVYCDKRLEKGGFKGECLNVRCGCTSVIKTHGLGPGMRKLDWAGAIFVMRNPYDAILAEMNRRHSKGHTGIAKGKFFQGNSWDRLVTLKTKQWESLFDQATAFFDQILVIHYEELKSGLKPQLRRIAQFLRKTSNTTLNRIDCALGNGTGHFKRNKTERNFDPFTPELRATVDDAIRRMIPRLQKAGNSLPPYAEGYLTQA